MTEEYREYLQSPQWTEKKRQIFQRALKNANSDNMYGVCESCGYRPYRPCLQIHHKTYEHIFNEPLEDLILLCPRCHRAETKKQKAERSSVPKTELSFAVKKRLAVLSTTSNYQKQINLMSWNGNPECFDIRVWDIKDEPKPLKGITLATDEIRALQEVLARLPELTGQEVT